jgi:hypothetical protein
MHFTRTSKRFNLKIGIYIAGIELKSKNQIKVLGIQLDPALRWNSQLKAVEARAVHQLNALKSIIGSTWGSSAVKMQRVYTATVRPSIMYSCNA